MSTEIPSVDITEDDCSSSYLDSTVTSDLSLEESLSITNLSEGNLSNFSLKDIKDDYIYDDNGDSDLKFPDSSDKNEGPPATSSQVTTIRQKDNRELSPFKEAIRGFVLSKLAKKSDSIGSMEGDKKTLFSGIKEKIVKKLEDSSNCKETILIAPEISDFEEIANDTGTTKKDECELRSVVANDRLDITAAAVEEAEECFEEIKVTTTTLRNGMSGSGDQNLSVSITPRSKTMSNIAATAQQLLRPKTNTDRNLSVSFSDLQKAEVDSIERDCALEVERSNPQIVPNFGTMPNSASVNSTEQCENTNAVMGEASTSRTTLTSQSPGFPRRVANFYDAFLRKFFRLDVFIVILAILAYYFLSNHSFVCGLVCGILISTLVCLLYISFINSLFPYDDSQFSSYNLPPHSLLSTSNERTFTHEGWMNQLNNDYDSNTYKLADTVSVYVRINNATLFLSYPRKNVPKRAMWNEKKTAVHSVMLEAQYSLLKAKVLLRPEGLHNNRIWNKRYPLYIVLAEQDVPIRETLDHTDETEQDSTAIKNDSQPSSVSSTPAHEPANRSRFYFFARTDREKEEWYWKFLCSSRGGFEDEHAMTTVNETLSVINESSPEVIQDAVTSPTSRSPKASLLPSKESDDSKDSYNYPFHFDEYMCQLIGDKEKDSSILDKTHVQWLNVFLGRLFFDFFVQKRWADKVMQRIQNKLDRIKMPQYMQQLVVRDVLLGKYLPQVKNVSDAVADERGLWWDFDIEYNGTFQMTLEMKLKRTMDKFQDDSHVGPEVGTDASNEDLCEYWDEDEDFPDSETSKEDSPSHQATAMSAGTKLLHSVEKWVNTSNQSEHNFVKRYVGQLIQTRLLLTVKILTLKGKLAVNLPPAPSDRLWYGFRTNPELNLSIFPKVGQRQINLHPVTQLIKRKLLQEFQKAVVMPNMDDITVPIMHSTVYDQL